jgi:Mn2+/Fe2+ NRAMP family transporter
LAIGVCAGAVLTATVLLVEYTHQDRISDRAAARAVDLLVLTIIIATVLTVSLLPFIPGPPPLALLIFSGVLLGITLSLVLGILRSLLHRAVLTRVELDEVV